MKIAECIVSLDAFDSYDVRRYYLINPIFVKYIDEKTSGVTSKITNITLLPSTCYFDERCLRVISVN